MPYSILTADIDGFCIFLINSTWEIFTSVTTVHILSYGLQIYFLCHFLHQCYEKYHFSSATNFHILQQVNFFP